MLHDGSRQREILAGTRILLVEDIFLLADELAECVAGLGCQVVGPKAQLESALAAAASEELDGAILDIDLEGAKSFPVAATLSARGIPFIFLTGYDTPLPFPSAFKDAPRLSKPVNEAMLARLMVDRFGRRGAGP